jgi:hypothetical protein
MEKNYLTKKSDFGIFKISKNSPDGQRSLSVNKEKLPQISKGTVYRNLKFLSILITHLISYLTKRSLNIEI